MFLNSTTVEDTLEHVQTAQKEHLNEINQWRMKYSLELIDDVWTYLNCIVVPKDNILQRGVIALHHDSQTAGHPGQKRTMQAIERNYWWPTIKFNTTMFVKGCAICQSMKP